MVEGLVLRDRPLVLVEVTEIGHVNGERIEISRNLSDCTLWIGDTPYNIDLSEYYELRRLAYRERS
jgi:hypothetical protein